MSVEMEQQRRYEIIIQSHRDVYTLLSFRPAHSLITSHAPPSTRFELLVFVDWLLRRSRKTKLCWF